MCARGSTLAFTPAACRTDCGDAPHCLLWQRHSEPLQWYQTRESCHLLNNYSVAPLERGSGESVCRGGCAGRVEYEGGDPQLPNETLVTGECEPRERFRLTPRLALAPELQWQIGKSRGK